MWPNWVWNPGPLTYESGALPTALRGPATWITNLWANSLGPHPTAPWKQLDLGQYRLLWFSCINIFGKSGT